MTRAQKFRSKRLDGTREGAFFPALSRVVNGLQDVDRV